MPDDIYHGFRSRAAYCYTRHPSISAYMIDTNCIGMVFACQHMAYVMTEHIGWAKCAWSLIQYEYIILPVQEIPLWRQDGAEFYLHNGISYTSRVAYLPEATSWCLSNGYIVKSFKSNDNVWVNRPHLDSDLVPRLSLVIRQSCRLFTAQSKRSWVTLNIWKWLCWLGIALHSYIWYHVTISVCISYLVHA